MLPFDGNPSSEPVRAPFVGARNFPVSGRIDYEDGPIDLSNSSMGLQYQAWRCAVFEEEVQLRALVSGQEYSVFSAPNITDISFTFDQNALYTCAYVSNELPYLRWYDSQAGQYTTTALDPSIITPKVSLDDKRQENASNSDIILGYVRGGNLYYRIQRDRYMTEYLFKEGVPGGLLKVGMNTQLRFQFALDSE